MKTFIENARRATEAAKEEITKLRNQIPRGESEHDMVDDAYLGVGWALKRLADLEEARSNGTA